jgi:hypothetical protein
MPCPNGDDNCALCAAVKREEGKREGDDKKE